MKKLILIPFLSFLFALSANTLQAQISGSSSVCEDTFAPYNCTQASATYQWHVEPMYQAMISDSTIQNPTIDFYSSGTYTVSVTTTGPSNTFTMTVTVNAAPTITSASTGFVCSGSAVNIPLTASVSSNFSWIGANNPNVAGESTGMQSSSAINNTLSTSSTTAQIVTYTVTATSMQGCVGTSQTVTVTVGPIPLLSFIPNQVICSSNSSSAINFACTPPTASVDWTNSNSSIGLGTSGTGNINGFTTPNVLSVQTGTITATPVLNGCSGAPRTFSITVLPLPTITNPATPSNPTCVSTGSLTGLTASGLGTLSYSWNNGLATTANLTGVGAGSYTIVITDGNGCTTDATYNLVSSGVPSISSANVVISPTNCSGSTGSITGISVSGTAPFMYSWNGGSPVTIPEITDVPAGTYTLTVTDANGCTATEVYTVTSLSAPASPIATNPTYCQNEGATSLTATSSGGTLMWYSDAAGTNFIGTSVMPNTNTSGITTYYVLETLNGCTSALTQVDVTVTPIPIVSASYSGPACTNDTVILSASGGISYSWSGPVGFSGVGQTVSINGVVPAMTGSYVVTATNSYGCLNSDVVHVLIHALPNVTVTAQNPDICPGATTILSASSSGAPMPASYTWTPTPAVVSPYNSATATSNTVTTTTTYTVFYTTSMANGGCSDSSIVTVNMFPATSISGTIHDAMNTPVAHGQVYLLVQSTASNLFDTAGVTSLNAMGEYNFAQVPDGIYLVKCIPDTSYYPQSITTYNGTNATWDIGSFIYHNCSANDTVNFDLINVFIGTGPGFISGWIIEGVGYGNRLINGANQVMTPGGPLKNVCVNLKKIPGGGYQGQTFTDSTGYYEFSNVPVGDYTLEIDIPGLPMDSSYFITIAANQIQSAGGNSIMNASYTNLDFAADSSMIYMTNFSVGIKNNAEVRDELLVFPNPAKNMITVKNGVLSNDSQIEIINNLGQVIRSEKADSEETQLNIENMSPGVYMIRVISGNTCNTQAFIKQ